MRGFEFVGGGLLERRTLQVGDGIDLEFDVVLVGVGGLVELPRMGGQCNEGRGLEQGTLNPTRSSSGPRTDQLR